MIQQENQEKDEKQQKDSIKNNTDVIVGCKPHICKSLLPQNEVQ